MRVAIISTIAIESSTILAKALNNNGVYARVFDKKETKRTDFSDFDYVFGYGCSGKSFGAIRINHREAIKICIDKTCTFDLLKAAKVNTVPYVRYKRDIPKAWDHIVIRDEIDGRMAGGLSYSENDQAIIPNGELFTEYFEHSYEYRIMVFMGAIVGRYYKREEDDDWYFNLQPKQGFELMDKHCLRAAEVLGIDYVGFDVVAKNKKDFRILEANSGPCITDEAENAIVSYFINL